MTSSILSPRWASALIFVIGLLSGCVAPGYHTREIMFHAEGAASMVSEEAGEPGLMRAFAVAGRGHYQYERWSFGMVTELNMFRTREIDQDWDALAAGLIGADASYLSANGYIRSMLSAGLAVLVEGTDIDEPGAVGFYIESRPVVFRFQMDEDLILSFAPLSGLVMVPEPAGIPIVDAQYRFAVGVEFL